MDASGLLYFSHLVIALLAAWVLAAIVLMPDGGWRRWQNDNESAY